MIANSYMMQMNDDQMQTAYNVIFPKGIPGGGDTNLISLRMDTQFDPPEMTLGGYEIWKKGVKIPKTNMTQDMDKSNLPIEIRLDQQWKVWDDLQKWAKLCYDFQTGTALGEAATRTDMYVTAEDAQGNIVKTIKYLGVKLKTLKVGTFDNQGQDPVRITATFIFNDMDFE